MKMDEAEIKARLASIAVMREVEEDLRFADMNYEIEKVEMDLEGAKDCYAVSVSSAGILAGLKTWQAQREIARLEKRIARLNRRYERELVKAGRSEGS